MTGSASSTPTHREDVRERSTLYALIILVLALVLRLYQLGTESLWIDEGFSLRDSQDFHLISFRPLYYLVLREWNWLIGTRSEFFLRLPAVIFGVAGVWMLYVLGRRLIDKRVALLASTFMAISVLHINHSQEVRMYSMTVFFSILSTYLLVLTLEDGKARYFAGYILSAMAAVLTHPVSVFFLAAHGIFVVLYAKAYKPQSYALITGGTLVVVGCIPWLMHSIHAAHNFGQGYSSLLERPDPLNVVGILGRFFLMKWSSGYGLVGKAALAFSLIVTGLMVAGLKGHKRTDTGMTLIALWLFVPMVSLIIVSYTVANTWREFYLISASPALFLLVAKGFYTMRSRRVAWAAMLIVVLLTLGRLGIYYHRNMRPEWRPAISYIQGHERPGDVIGVYLGGNWYVFRYYYHGKSGAWPLGQDLAGHKGLVGWDEKKARAMFDSFPLTGKRFWVIMCNHSYAGGPVILDYIDKHYKVLEHRLYSHMELLLLKPGGQGSAEARSPSRHEEKSKLSTLRPQCPTNTEHVSRNT